MKNTVVIYSTPSCHYCRMAKKLAEQRGCDVKYLTFGKDFQREDMFENFPGARTFRRLYLMVKKLEDMVV